MTVVVPIKKRGGKHFGWKKECCTRKSVTFNGKPRRTKTIHARSC